MFIIAVIDWEISVSLINVSLQFDIGPTRQVHQKKKKRWTAETRMGAGGIFLYLLQGIELKTKLIKVIHRGTWCNLKLKWFTFKQAQFVHPWCTHLFLLVIKNASVP